MQNRWSNGHESQCAILVGLDDPLCHLLDGVLFNCSCMLILKCSSTGNRRHSGMP